MIFVKHLNYKWLLKKKKNHGYKYVLLKLLKILIEFEKFKCITIAINVLKYCNLKIVTCLKNISLYTKCEYIFFFN